MLLHRVPITHMIRDDQGEFTLFYSSTAEFPRDLIEQSKMVRYLSTRHNADFCANGPKGFLRYQSWRMILFMRQSLYSECGMRIGPDVQLANSTLVDSGIPSMVRREHSGHAAHYATHTVLLY